MFIYHQKTGNLFHNATIIETGYSGTKKGRNNPEMEAVPNVGPIPKGDYKIANFPINSKKLGPYSIPLYQKVMPTTHTRSGFWIHGNNSKNDASTGCIILSRAARNHIIASGDKDLSVVE